MSIQALIDFKNALKSYAPLTDYLQERYSTPGKHTVGYEMGSSNAKDRPAFFYVEGGKIIEKLCLSSKSRGIIIFQVVEKDTVDECKKGVLVCDAVMEMLVDFIRTQPISGVTFSDLKSVTDFYTQDPYYEVGISFSYVQDRVRKI